jgi:hypothetical protein
MAGPTNTERVAALAAENALLLDFLQRLSPEDWSRPSACDRWSIADVVAHLVGVTDPDRLTDALAGVPEQRARPTEDEFREGIGTRAIAQRKQLGSDLLSTFEADTATYLLVMYGRHPVHEAVQSRRMRATGPAELVDTLERSFVAG